MSCQLNKFFRPARAANSYRLAIAIEMGRSLWSTTSSRLESAGRLPLADSLLRQPSSYLVVFTSCVVLKQCDAFTVQPPVVSFPLKNREEEEEARREEEEETKKEP